MIICGLGLLPAAAGAQESTVALEEIVVTGTRIARADAAAPSPTLVVESTAFAERAAFTVESTLNAFPQFTPAAGSASVSPDSDGLATLSLRGLGPTRTLVLVNGRRLIPGDGLGQVDLNVLPPQLIETVEVVTGGASAVYGSDAVAGVVNFRLREDFTGVHLAGQWSQTDHGDGQEYNAGLTAGTDVADGAGSIVAYLGYSERDQVMQDARAFSRAPLSYYPDETTGVGPQGRFLAMGDAVTDDGFGVVFAEPAVFDHLFESYGYPAGSVPYQPLMRLNEDGTVFTGGLTAVGTEVPGGVANYRGEPDPVLSYRRAYTYDFAPHTALQLPLERTTGFVAGRYQLSDAAELFGQLHYADYTASRRLAPAVTSIALVPVTNPHITPDLRLLLDARANPAAPFRLQKRTTAVGPRIADNDRQLLQATVGVNGRVHDWSYEVYAQFGRNERTEQQSGNVRLSRVEELTFAADGGLAICGGFDPFSKAPISAACADHIAVVASNEVTVEQWLGEASISGELFDLPAGPARIAAGVFHKHDEFDYRADPVLTESLPGVPGVIGPRPDVVGFPAGADRAGSESNTDVYVEAVLPLLRLRPGAAALELGLGYRRAEYDQAGGVDAWKADLVFRPVESAALRGSYQRAVRAPSIEELFYPEINDEFFIRPPDPCDPNSPERQGPDQSQVEALCVAQGMSPELLATYENPLARVKGVTGGNPELEPEQADTYTLGLVLTSPFSHAALATLQLSLDWYWIEVDDAVGRWDAESAVGRCFDPNYNPTYDPGNVFCTFFERIPETGEIFARVIDRNLGSLETAGLDLQLAWAVEAGPGRLTTEAYFTHVSRWRLRDPGGTTLDYAGTIGGQVLGHAFPEWKGQLRLGYGWGQAELYARWRYVDHLRDVEYPAFVVPHRDYLDVGATHSFDTGLLKGLVLRAGIDNLLDEEPPVYPSYQQANTEPSLYDVLGRRYYLAATWQF